MSAPGAPRGRWTALSVLVLVRIAMGFQFQSVASLGPLLREDLGIDFGTTGMLLGLYLAPGLILTLPGAAIIRRLGDRGTVLCGLGLMTLGGTATGLVDAFWPLFAGRLVAGLGVVLLYVVMTKMVTDWFVGFEASTAMALYLNGWPIGIGLGLVTQPLLAQIPLGGAAIGWQGVFLLAAGLCLIAWLGVLLVYRDAPSLRAGGGGGPVRPIGLFDLTFREIWLCCTAGIMWGCWTSSFSVIVAFAPDLLRSQAFSLETAALIVSINLWVSMAAMPLGGVLADKVGRPNLIIVVAQLISIAAMTAIVFVPAGNGTAQLLLFALVGISGSLPAAQLILLPAEILRPTARAAGMSVFYIWFYAGNFGLPTLAGTARDLTHWDGAPILVSAALMALVLTLLGVFRLGQRAGRPLPLPEGPASVAAKL